MWDAEFKLVIYPVTTEHSKGLSNLEALLKDIQLIGDRLSEDRFQVGDEFLSLLTFMGCSPNMELEPQKDGSAFCYIELNETQSPQFVSGSNLKKARCTHCKAEVAKLDKKALCAQCKQPLVLDKINWRKTAFVAQSWITIGNIYELEAIPNDELLNTLHHKTGVQWKPAYIRHATSRDLT